MSQSLSTPLNSFLHWEKNAPGRTFLRQPINGKWITWTYREAGEEIRKVASLLKSFGFQSPVNIALLSKNCAHWIMADLAIMMSGHVSVPIYPTLSAAGVKEILDHSEARLIFIGKLDTYDQQRSGIPESLQRISFSHYGISEGIRWEDVVSQQPVLQEDSAPDVGSLATIMYSSGTTGTPKGVMLTHGCFGYVGDQVKTYLQIKKPERFFSYLPLSHIAERGLMEMVALSSGSSISFAESLDTFQKNLQHEKPTIFGGVPRIYAKFQEGVLKKLPQKKLDNLLRLPLIGGMLRKVLRKKLGLSEARIIVSGAAPIPVSLLEWFSKLGMDICEMYGMTENTAYSHANYQKIKFGTVGQPWPGVEVKRGDQNEILVRHRALMTGYFKDPDTTKSVFTPDGFLRTGDQGEIDPDGFLTITGRIKDQFKTDKAKFISPAHIELSLSTSEDIEQVCVVGTGIPQPLALVVLSEKGKGKDQSVLIRDLEKTLGEVNQGLEDYEKLHTLVVLKEEWTIMNGLMTPSLKVKRNEVEKVHRSRYAEWYSKATPVLFA